MTTPSNRLTVPSKVFYNDFDEGACRWLDRLTADLEGDGYIVLSAVLSANVLGAPHQRRRLYWGG